MTTGITVKRIGDSLGLILSKDAVSALGAAEGKAFYLVKSSDGRCYLTALDPELSKQTAIAKKGMRRYRNTLLKLSK